MDVGHSVGLIYPPADVDVRTWYRANCGVVPPNWKQRPGMMPKVMERDMTEVRAPSIADILGRVEEGVIPPKTSSSSTIAQAVKQLDNGIIPTVVDQLNETFQRQANVTASDLRHRAASIRARAGQAALELEREATMVEDGVHVLVEGISDWVRREREARRLLGQDAS